MGKENWDMFYWKTLCFNYFWNYWVLLPSEGLLVSLKWLLLLLLAIQISKHLSRCVIKDGRKEMTPPNGGVHEAGPWGTGTCQWLALKQGGMA